MAGHEYSAADITVLEFDEAVRKRPGMYFEVGLDDPRLPMKLLEAAARHALHPATRVAEVHSLVAAIDILDDLCFQVTIKQRHAWADSPLLGYFDSLIGPEWWLLAAIATLCGTTSVDVWSEDRAFRQELTGLRPSGPPERIGSPMGSGIRIAFTLDEQILPAGTALPTELESLDAHGPDCAPGGPGYVLVHDHRPDSRSSIRLS
ncbi:hypothetical protein EDD29_5762 [Actinocorallia herbida]|uniref:Uncharacterized protein n=1 Tax=Actinocorallia herbida TaxID=58109 RepID=A0A3N1D3I9_9ACTN|nr:hypothetical protein [Actinocorallia herbida]ROO88104.1 hypothetical protein EDD29_5762 [Actinocorallia herbida]